jgi:hypothetical protein
MGDTPVHVIGAERGLRRHQSLQATRLVHERFGTIMLFVYSRAELRKLIDQRFLGEWKYLHKALFEIPEEAATRALIDLALYIRLIDDDEERDLSNYYGDRHTYGEVTDLDGSHKSLRIRDVANKIIHASRYEWVFPTGEADPRVVCFPSEDQLARGYKWASATINLPNLGTFCGALMS